MKERWNRRLMWLGVLWGIILVCWCLMGCRTKSVVEVVEMHDTIRVMKSDTVREVRTSVVHDTLRMKDFVTVTVRESGETIRVDRWVDRWKVVERHDTVDTYKSKADSLQAVVDKMSKKEIVKTPWFWRWGWKVLAVVAAVVAASLLLRRVKK